MPEDSHLLPQIEAYLRPPVRHFLEIVLDDLPRSSDFGLVVQSFPDIQQIRRPSSVEQIESVGDKGQGTQGRTVSVTSKLTAWIVSDIQHTSEVSPTAL